MAQSVRDFILSNIERHPRDIAALAAKHFQVTRQAVNKHLKALVSEGALSATGHTRDRAYKLVPLSHWSKTYSLASGLEEDQVWSKDIVPNIGALSGNARDVWHFCFTEMFNNAMDHSGGSEIQVAIVCTASSIEIMLSDDGVGIFRKIRSALDLLDERHAVLELAKGKLTTDPDRHTGEGIFFTSRLVDLFFIHSGGIYFGYEVDHERDWIEELPVPAQGTVVYLKLSRVSSRTIEQVSSQFSSGEDHDFSKTVVPVKRAQYGEDRLISRSQAKRLLARVDRFKSVWFDFEGVETIGQAFADEIFRVFARSHPAIELVPIHANPAVQQMIQRARSQWAAELPGSI